MPTTQNSQIIRASGAPTRKHEKITVTSQQMIS